MKIEIEKDVLKSLLILGAVVEARDAYTGGHLWRVSQYAKLLSSQIGLSRGDILRITVGGFLHDLGKVGVPDGILAKPDALTNDEYGIIKTHPVVGDNLIREHPLAALARDPIRHHHERIDGEGYPDRQNQENMSLASRIIGIADAFDAMTSTRPYRAGMLIEEALAILRRESNKQFDAKLVDSFVQLNKRDELAHIVKHSDHQIPLLTCPSCGPVIAASRHSKDGDTLCCKVCGGEMRLHRHGFSFETEPTYKQGTPEQLKPDADMAPIDDLIEQLPKELVVN